MPSGVGDQPPPAPVNSTTEPVAMFQAEATNPPSTSMEGEFTNEDGSLTPAAKMTLDSLTPGQHAPDFSDADSMTTDDEGFSTVISRKAKKRFRKAKSESSTSSTIVSIDAPPSTLTVIFTPVDQTKVITNLNEIKLTELLESKAPAGIIRIRPNHRLNLMSVDTRNAESCASLLKMRFLLGTAVRAFEPRSQTQATGVIKGVDTGIDIAEIREHLKTDNDTPIASAHRLGTSTTVVITFTCASLPEHVLLGLVRHRVEPFVEKPIQCHLCLRFGHIQAMCRNSPTCSRCSGPHQRTDCNDGTTVRCCNCGKQHEATSHQCAKWKKELEVRRLRQVTKMDYKTARSTVSDTFESQTAGETMHQQNRRTQQSMHNRPVNTNNANTNQENGATLSALGKMPAQHESLTQVRAFRDAAHNVTEVPQGSNEHPNTNERGKQGTSYRNALTGEFSSKQTAPTKEPARSSPTSFGIWSAIILTAEKYIREFLAQCTSPVAGFALQVLDYIMPLLTNLSR